MQLEHALQLLDEACTAGAIRPLDRAFARFLADMEPGEDGAVLLAGALVSRQLGHGQVCVRLTELSDSDWLPKLDRAAWLTAFLASRVIACGPGNSPLTLAGERLYLRRYWQYEIDVARGILDRVVQASGVPDDLPHQLRQLFPDADPQHTDWQLIACALAARNAFSVISGGPGTGKTTTVVKLLALLQQHARTEGRELRIQLAAPTGKAAARLGDAIDSSLQKLPETLRSGIPSSVTTLHRLLGAQPGTRQLRHHRYNPLHADLVIVDEASMIDLEMMAALLQALRPQARLILLGDKDQLASVEAGSVLGDICAAASRHGYDQATRDWLRQVTGYQLLAAKDKPRQTSGPSLSGVEIQLTVSHRFKHDSGIGQLATAVNNGDSASVEHLLQPGAWPDLRCLSNLQQFDDLALNGWRDDIALGYRHYLQVLQQQRPQQPGIGIDAWAEAVLNAFESFQVLCAVRQGDWGVEAINRRIAALLQAEGMIQQSHGWYEGRPVLINRNDYNLGLMNGDIGITLRVRDSPSGNEQLRVMFRQSRQTIKQVLPSRLQDIEDVYAMTVHKSQGSEFGHVALILPEQTSPLLTRELLYTGITRAKQRFSLLCSNPQRLKQSVETRVIRVGGLSQIQQGIDY